jgi:hypothetical protein
MATATSRCKISPSLRVAGNALNVRLLSHANDSATGEAVAAIVPLAPLRSATTYDVSFSGTVSGCRGHPQLVVYDEIKTTLLHDANY